MGKRYGFWLLLFLAALGLTACGAGGENPAPEDGVLTYAALNPVEEELSELIEKFNAAHEDVQIEIRNYSDENGVQRLFTELALGQVPDIMEMHRLGTGKTRDFVCLYTPYLDPPKGEYWMPYQQMVQKGYLENLWPYIEEDPELGRDGVLEAPLKAAEVNGGLYLLFSSVSVTTMIGPEHVVGNRSGWTFDEMRETFSTMPEDSTILRFNLDRKDMFDMLCTPLLDQYVDWETGGNSFDSQGFRDMMQFLESFPAEFESFLSQERIDAEIVERMLTGRQMLDAVTVGALWFVPIIDTNFGDRATYIGYPTADGSLGSYFTAHGSKLSMSSSCWNKEAAWEFMRQVVAKKYNARTMEEIHTSGSPKFEIKIPVVRQNYELAYRLDLRYPWRADLIWGPLDTNYFEIGLCTKDQAERFETLVNNTTQIYWPNNDLSDIVWETIEPYFAGDRTLDDTLRLLDNRVTVYVNENR